MRIKTVHYLATIHLGNYSDEKIGFTAEMDEQDDEKEIIETLRQKSIDCALPDIDDVRNDIRKYASDLRAIKKKLEQTRSEWNAMVEFLRTQGIKKDVVDMPMLTNLLPKVKQEVITNSEIEEDQIQF